MTWKTSAMSVFVHAAIFAALLYYADQIPGLNQIEGFESDMYCNTTGAIWAIAIGSMIIGGIIVGAVTFFMGRNKTVVRVAPAPAPVSNE